MRWVLALGILVMTMLGVAGPTYDSGVAAHAEEAPPALKKSDQPRIAPAPDGETAWDQYQRLMLRSGPAYQTYLPKRMFEERRGPLVGDFWRPGEFYNLLGRPNDNFSR